MQTTTTGGVRKNQPSTRYGFTSRMDMTENSDPLEWLQLCLLEKLKQSGFLQCLRTGFFLWIYCFIPYRDCQISGKAHSVIGKKLLKNQAYPHIFA
jgi:hypothetical protein